MLDFAQNFNVYKVEGLETLIKENTNAIFHYPDHKHEKLKKTIAEKFNLSHESVAIGNGTTELIFTLPGVISKNDAVICYPTFWEYTEANKKGKNIIDYFAKEDANFRLHFDDLESVLSGSSAVYVCNPNNPTSVLIEKEGLLSFIKHHPVVDFIVDETYLIFREDYADHSFLKEAERLKNLYVITSLSKVFFIPGLRFGFLVSHPDNIKTYYDCATPYLTNPLAEILIPYLLSQDEYMRKTKSFYSMQRSAVYEQFNKEFTGILKPFKPEANFILLKILTDFASTEVVVKMKELGIIIRDGAEFKGLGDKWIRVGIRTAEEQNQLATAFHKIL